MFRTKRLRPCGLYLLGILLVTGCGQSQSEEIEQGHPDIRVEKIFDGLGVPWGMTFLSPAELLITERGGGVSLLRIDRGQAVDIGGAPAVVAEGQGGLLDVAAGPEYASDGWIYFTYSKAAAGEAATTLARARLDGNRLADWQDLLITDSATSSRRHFGSRITFDGKGHLFFSVGDRGERPLAQDLGNHVGTILRLNLDGSIPADNPFVNDNGARDEIWSYGHRNPQGLWYDRDSGQLWSIEHGPRGGDEINLILEGRNYGWPEVSHGKEYWGPIAVGDGTSKPGMEDPRKVYIPSIAPGSLFLYRGDAFNSWDGNLFSGALKLRHINRVTLDANGEAVAEERLLEDVGERIRALIPGPDGLIYFSTDSGGIFRIRPAS